MARFTPRAGGGSFFVSVMKRYSLAEILTAIAGLTLIVFGVWTLAFPKEFTITPDSTNGRAEHYFIGNDEPVHVSIRGDQAYGALSLCFGLGFLAIALYKSHDQL